MRSWHRCVLTSTRRAWLASAVAWSCASSLATAQSRPKNTTARCPRCFGLTRIPLKDAKPFVWVDGMPPPRAEDAVGEQACPECQMQPLNGRIVAEIEQQIETAQANHRLWEERTGWKLTCVLTRHAALHTQLTEAQAKTVGAALENLTLHLKRISGSLALCPSRLDTYEQIVLWEKPSWEQFRGVMESLYTPQQLGEAWNSARNLNSYDHIVTPHLYETPETVRHRPLSVGPVFLAARRQIELATERHAPLWLSHGFAAYGDHAVHKLNRWYMLYDRDQAPPVGDWLAEARKLAIGNKLRSWPEMLRRELRDWKPADYAQTTAMVAFLLESEPQKFIDFLGRIAAGDLGAGALEDAYQAPLDKLEQLAIRWLRARR